MEPGKYVIESLVLEIQLENITIRSHGIFLGFLKN